VSSLDRDELAGLIAQRGREVVLERLRAAFAHQVAKRDAADLDPARLEQFVQEAATRAGGALWRRSLAEAAMQQLEIDLPEALEHPALKRAEELVAPPAYGGTPAAPEPEPIAAEPDAAQMDATATYTVETDAAETDVTETDRRGGLLPSGAEPKALRLSAVHINGIETLRHGDRDIELRLSDAGLDVLTRSTGAAIGRLEWREIESVELPPPRRGLRAGRRSRELHVSTGRGEAQFELPGLTEEELHEHLEPTLARLAGKRARGKDARPAGD
jgi:hypothetical protein